VRICKQKNFSPSVSVSGHFLHVGQSRVARFEFLGLSWTGFHKKFLGGNKA